MPEVTTGAVVAVVAVLLVTTPTFRDLLPAASRAETPITVLVVPLGSTGVVPQLVGVVLEAVEVQLSICQTS